ncbi:hypothetical protein D8X55_02510 [Malacoplasma penetrans]|uniref:MYPE 2560 paralog, 57 n=1 Tax=Malacoplasma penetrans (strain HF-2) TaxID=272633 RepID=Q8EWD4_MALP2|nr:lipoprotein 17-related variable surface protein [Malacoplasma penetrans]RXY96755.1 hypothetical protein D8X55_02510 [Malacoplasma penetrans]BAC44062.1 MYPE 2560 paralog, 57% [Malacoplasma penetrans HF-2]
MSKLSKKITLSAITSVLSIATGLSIGLPISNNSLKNSSITNISSSNQSTTASKLAPSEANDQNANLSTSNGPITFLGNKITALDWYGNKLWEKDLSTLIPDYNGKVSTDGSATNYDNGPWKRAWFNWDYNRNTDLLWIIGYWSPVTKKQPLLGIKASSGDIQHNYDIDYQSYTSSLGATTTGTAYRFVSALASGKVMIYGGAATAYNGKGLLFNPSDSTLTLLNGNSATESIFPPNDSEYGTKYRWYFFNLIPIGNNKNFVEVLPFSRDATTGDAGYPNANYNVYFLLVDDNLNLIETTGTWSKLVKVADGMQNYRNTKITPQRDYYTMLDGKVVTVVYNTAIVINATGNSINYGTYPMSEAKWIKSWAFDSNQNLYFKFKDESTIYKVSGSAWSSLNNNTSSAIAPNTYLDLAGIPQTKDYANNLIIYNVYGYTGQLMMVNSKYNENVDTSNSGITEDANPDKLGLALAVTQNANSQNQGDYKGILNGDDSIQKASDFELSQSAIDSKIPSEITRSDINTLNSSFLKNASDFTITKIDDANGTIEIQCNLYQIPWFASELPSNITPRVVTHQYTTTNKINNKISWKTLSETTDYDFLNMKPSKIAVDDVTNLDPFQVSFQSQIITTAQGQQLYPKKTYSVSDPNDTAGTIKVSVKYEYVPMGLSYSTNNVKSYETNFTYTVFKSTDTPAFRFTGQTTSGSSASIDVSNVAELKNLLNASTLPSSFNYLNSSTDSTNSAFLQFINTANSKGYPISKMKFTVTADDVAGTLKITATMPASYSPKNSEETFTVTYTNLNKAANYKFNFKTSSSSIGSQNFSTLLPSSITDGDIINNLIEYQGFNSNDFTITKTANDQNGTLLVQISLNSSYASAIGNGNAGFKNYSATHTFTGFMNEDQYNERFNVEFVDDSSEVLIDLKQMQSSQVYDTLVTKNTSLTVGNTTYNNLKELVEKLLITKLGSLVPTGWKDNASIDVGMYYDNSQGTASFYVNIPKSLMAGANSDLNLVANYTGFLKGNAVQTNDNLSFVSDNMLKNYLISKGFVTKEQYEAFTAASFAEWLKEDNNAIKLITYKTGQYEQLLNDPTKYSINIVANTTQKTVSVYIHFNGITDSNSLSEYSVVYAI